MLEFKILQVLQFVSVVEGFQRQTDVHHWSVSQTLFWANALWLLYQINPHLLSRLVMVVSPPPQYQPFRVVCPLDVRAGTNHAVYRTSTHHTASNVNVYIDPQKPLQQRRLRMRSRVRYDAFLPCRRTGTQHRYYCSVCRCASSRGTYDM